MYLEGFAQNFYLSRLNERNVRATAKDCYLLSKISRTGSCPVIDFEYNCWQRIQEDMPVQDYVHEVLYLQDMVNAEIEVKVRLLYPMQSRRGGLAEKLVSCAPKVRINFCINATRASTFLGKVLNSSLCWCKVRISKFGLDHTGSDRIFVHQLWIGLDRVGREAIRIGSERIQKPGVKTDRIGFFDPMQSSSYNIKNNFVPRDFNVRILRCMELGKIILCTFESGNS